MTQGFFNFSHDLALARNVERYTAPLNVRLMERDLKDLAAYFPQGEVSFNPQAPVWGWDLALTSKLRSLGYNDLPTSEQLDQIRQLSSRRTAVETLRSIIEKRPDLPLIGQSWFVESEAELESLMATGGAADSGAGEFVLKEPLSGSGRGLRFVHGQPTGHQRNWALRCIREQGGVVVEPMYRKEHDFALEFLVETDKIRFLGLSLFCTNQNNVYSGNVIAPQEVLWSRLTQSFPKEVFDSLIQTLIAELSPRFVGKYLGPIGVDMMIVAPPPIPPRGEAVTPADEQSTLPLGGAGRGAAIHPCVEINVRRTMGELSLHLAELIAPYRTGFFFLHYDKEADGLKNFVASLDKPVFDAQGRLLCGAKLLTPIGSDTHYAAFLSVE